MELKKLTKDSSRVIVSSNIANAETEIIDIEVPPTYNYIIFDRALLQLWLKITAGSYLPDNSEVNVYVTPPDKSEFKRIDSFILAGFGSSVNQWDRDQQNHISLERDVALPELYHLIFKAKSTAVIDWTRADVDFGLEIKKY